MSAVTIVGAGPAGCTLALLLSRYDIASTVIERRTIPLNHPAAHVVNGRSQEIWQQASPALARRISALAAPVEEIRLIRWCTDLRSEPLGEIDLLADEDHLERVARHSRFIISHIGQHQLMPVLWEALEADPHVDFRRGVRVRDVTTTSTGATVRLADMRGVTTQLSSRFVVGADGANSAVRQALGIAMRGPVLANMGSVFFNAKLHADGVRPLLSWIYSPAFCGVLIAHADDDYVLMTPFLTRQQKIARDGHAFWARTLPRVIGKDVPFRIHSAGTWTMTSRTAESFARGAVFLAGDAAHPFPHTGGFGLNSGVQDAHNLAWKFAAVLEGRAPAALLDSYEPERRPVVERFAAQSVANHFRLDDVMRGLGPSNLVLARVTRSFPSVLGRSRFVGRIADGVTQLALRPTSRLSGDRPAARYRRATVRRRVPAQLEHFISTGLEFGYAYSGPLIRSEPTRQPLEGSGVRSYRETTWPGARVPHLWLASDGDQVSNHELLDLRKYTLFTPVPGSWHAVLPDVAPVVVVGLDTAIAPDRQTVLDVFEVGEHGAVLVRPDGHVAWRTRSDATSAAAALRALLSRFGTSLAQEGVPS